MTALLPEKGQGKNEEVAWRVATHALLHSHKQHHEGTWGP